MNTIHQTTQPPADRHAYAADGTRGSPIEEDDADASPDGQDPGRPIAYPHSPIPLLRGLTLATVAIVLSLAAVWRMAPESPHPLLEAFRQSGLLRVALASLLLVLSGLIGTWVMAWARRMAAQPPSSTRRRRWLAGLRGDRTLVGRAARWPQAFVTTVLGAAGIACGWLLPSSAGPAPDAIILGATAIAVSFPLLLAERVVAATPVTHLPEAPRLRALLLLAVLAVPAAGLLQIAAGVGVPSALRLNPLILLALTAVTAEICVRSLARCFLPPPAPAVARAAVDSVLARLIADGVRTGSITVPVRQQFGIDFSRSWALAYLRAATPPVLLLLLLLGWGLSGVVLIGLDQRGIYERFGAPVTVLHPGLHTILPWPMGQVRRLDFGTVHETTLADIVPTSPPSEAEALPPPEADRLWEQAHPAEVTLLIASRTNGQPGFQAISADIKLRFRIGLSDHDVLNSAYRVTEPDVLLRAAARQVVAAFFATRTLEQALGENREAMAEHLRAAIQEKLDANGCGIDLAMLVIEAIHPPAGAADAYHAVQAAQIMAQTSILRERGAALSTWSNASQQATAIVAQANAASAEVTGTATADLTRFNADHAATITGGEAFLLERRLTSIANGLAQSSLTIIDHRIPPGDAPTVDLRPMSPLTARSSGHEPTARDKE